MTKDPAIIYAKLQSPDGWEREEKSSYDAEKLTEEYRERLYSEKAKRLFLKKTKQETPPTR